MQQYIIRYIGGDKPSTPDQGRRQFIDYQRWLVSLGDAVITPMMPYRDNHTITPDGAVNADVGSDRLVSGHTVIKAESIEAAIVMAKQCPFLKTNGSLEVAELVKIN